MKIKKGFELDRDSLRELIHYDPMTGIFTFRPRSREWFVSDRAYAIWNTRFAGKVTGNLHKSETGRYSYIEVCILGKIVKAHRLAWLYMVGDPVPKCIDHIDRDATNNAWGNIRDGRDINPRNASRRNDNSSGVTGVSFYSQTGLWRARANIKGREKLLGSFSEIDEAAMAVMEARLEDGYSPSHGLERKGKAQE